jgi:hypothetical protein
MESNLPNLTFARTRAPNIWKFSTVNYIRKLRKLPTSNGNRKV